MTIGTPTNRQTQLYTLLETLTDIACNQKTLKRFADVVHYLNLEMLREIDSGKHSDQTCAMMRDYLAYTMRGPTEVRDSADNVAFLLKRNGYELRSAFNFSFYEMRRGYLVPVGAPKG
jgi:hypothetical protein